MMSVVKTAVSQANWGDIRERSLWTGVQTALGYLSAEAVLLALEAAGVELPDGWVYPLTVLLAGALSVLKNVVAQYLASTQGTDDEDLSIDVVDEVPISVEDAYSIPSGEVGEGEPPLV